MIAFSTGDVGGFGPDSTITIVFPVNTTVPTTIDTQNVTVNGSDAKAVSATPASRQVIITTPVAIGDNSSVTIVFKAVAGIKNPTTAGSSYTLTAHTTAEPTDVNSNSYEITASTVTTPNVALNSSQPSTETIYTISFNVGAGGALSANSSTITIDFHDSTGVSSTIPASSITVNGTLCSVSPTINSTSKIITITTPVSVNNNGSVEVVFNEGITNPSTQGDYTLTVKTSDETSEVTSNAYTITTATSVSGIIVTIDNVNASASAKYTIDFTANDGDWQDQDKIFIAFPSGFTVPDFAKEDHSLYIDSSPVSVKEALESGQTAIVQVEGDHTGTSIRVIIGDRGGSNPQITNSSTASSNYVLGIKTTNDANQVNSPRFTIVSGSGVSAPSVTPAPSTSNTAAAYDIDFNTSSNGALGGGRDTIRVVFPSGTTVPSSMSASNVTVNGNNPSEVTPNSASRTVKVLVPNNISASSPVSLEFNSSAGLKNPTVTEDTNKTLTVKTNIDTNTTTSSNYTITVLTQVSAATVTPDPSTAGLTAQYTLDFAMGNMGLAVGDTVTVTFPSGTTVPSSITSGNVTVTANDTSVTVSGVNTTPASHLTRIIVGESVAASSSMEITFASAAGIKNPTTAGTSYTLDLAATSNGSAESNVYGIAESKVTSATVTPNPSTQNNTAQYTIAFNLGSGGALTAGSSTITIQFPTGTTIPASMAASNATVNSTVLSVAPTTTPSTRTVVLTTPVSVGNNGPVTVVFSNSANIQNPSTVSSTYTLDVSTSKETTPVASQAYSITSGTDISQSTVTLVDPQRTQDSQYTIQYNAGTGGIAVGDTLFFVFPSGTTIPASIPASTVEINGVDALTVLTTPASRLIRPVSNTSVSGGASVTVDFTSTVVSEKIANPSSSGSNHTLTARIGQGSTPISSTKYTVTSLNSETLTTATVTPTPNTSNTTAAYTLSFDTGANGAMVVGDSIVVVFPSGTTVPSSMVASNINVNSTSCTVAPAINAAARRIAVATPVAIGASQSVSLVFNADAGLVNPTSPSSYTLDDLHTNIQPTPNSTVSNGYNIVTNTDISSANVTPAPNTVNTTAQYTIAFTTGNGGIAVGDTIVVIFPNDTVVPSSITASNVTVNSVGATEVLTDPGSRKLEAISNTTVGANASVNLVLKLAASIVNPTTSSSAYTLQARTTGDPTLVTSNTYTIDQSTVTAADVTVNPTKTDSLAQYNVAFNVGTGGALATDSTITITFPSGTVLGSAVQGTPGNTTVNGTAVSSISVSGQQVTVTVPSGVNIPNNGSATVIFANAADMITNPSTAGTNYQVTVNTSAEPTPVASNTYAIFETTTVTPAVVTPNPTSSGNLSQYTISFNVGDSGALTALSDTIKIAFPSGTLLGSAVQGTPSNTTVNSTAASSVSVSGQQVRVTVPSGVNIPNNGSVTVAFANAADMVTNPSTTGSNQTVAVSTSQELNSITSNTYTITSSSTSVSAANVSVDPDTVSQTAYYTIEFSVGANGALIAGDQITVAFPSPTTVPGSIAAGSIQLNSTSCTTTPQINGDTVTVYTPVYINASGSVSLVFLSSAGIVNPPSGVDPGYTLDVNTNIEISQITSNVYPIYNEDGSLPVELAYFGAFGENEHIVLKWRTESEIYNSHWIVESKAEWENAYKSIGTLRGQGNKSTYTEYTYTDSTVTKGVLYYYRIADVSFDGVVTYHGPVSALSKDKPLPKEFSLGQNYPNPFNAQTVISYAIPVDSWVKVEIYNVLGQLVRTLIEDRVMPGYYRMIWDGNDNWGDVAASGTYFCVMTAGPGSEVTFRSSRKVLMLK